MATTSGSGDPTAVVIGGGIAGIVLALLLKKRLNIVPVIFEQAPRFDDDVGGGIGMYPNGLKIIQDVSQDLLMKVRAVGEPLRVRRWMRHDGTEIAVADDKHLRDWKNEQEAADLNSIGIRRWRLQKVLYEAAIAAGIPIVFNQRLRSIDDQYGRPVRLTFEGGATVQCDMVFGCDGARSVTRAQLSRGSNTEPVYTGYTILMGAAPVPRSKPGINFPSAPTTRVHAVFYPSGPSEQVFQFYFAGPERPETWRPLTAEEGAAECRELANRLKADGWSSEFTEPLLSARSVLRVGLRARDPLPIWYKGRVVLLGDAAHPPVPYIGQGAMMAIEDAGVLSLLLQRLCRPQPDAAFDMSQWESVLRVYEAVRIPRTTAIYRSSHALGRTQQARMQERDDPRAAREQEERLRSEVRQYGTLKDLRAASNFDCQGDAERALSALQPRDMASRL